VQTLELLGRARAGDQAAVADLYRRYEPRVRGLAAVRLGRSLVDFSDCDDIVQEALLAALAMLDRFEPRSDGAFVHWLATIVETRIHNAHRSGQAQKRGGGAVQRRADLGITTLSALAGADQGPSPSQEAAARELDPRLERALLGLGSPLRQIVYSRLVLDMSFAEIAAELGLASADSARAMFHKALAHLREQLEPGPGSPDHTQPPIG
jgi:RNA polymerase sigma-70 factor (ECF subfamily)